MSNYLASRRKFLGLSGLGDGPSDPPIAIYDANGNPVEMTVYGSGDGQYSAWAPELFMNFDVGNQPQQVLAPGYTSNVIPTYEPLIVTDSPLEIVSQFTQTNNNNVIPPVTIPPSIAQTTPTYVAPVGETYGPPVPAPSPAPAPAPVPGNSAAPTPAPQTPVSNNSGGGMTNTPIYYGSAENDPAGAGAETDTATPPSKLPLVIMALFALLAS